ncbi:hypothetical protein C8R44DRAFT_864173 [Mycena epipterygia]|nr:hypothetical protein C8R44DRAFT_864173 [Mycena epipterygia]
MLSTPPTLKRKRSHSQQVLCFEITSAIFFALPFSDNLRVVDHWYPIAQSRVAPTPFRFYQLNRPLKFEEVKDLCKQKSLMQNVKQLEGWEPLAALIPQTEDLTLCHFFVAPPQTYAPVPQTPNTAGDRQKFIETYLEDKIAPSTFGDHSQYRQITCSDSNLETIPATDRPLGAHPPVPNILLCKIFREFIDNVKNSQPSTEDYALARSLRDTMSSVHPRENTLRDAVNAAFSTRLGKVEPQGSGYSYHTIGGIPGAMSEAKVDYGASGAEPHFQIMQYYTEETYALAAASPLQRLPMLLLTYVGSYMDFSGAVWGSDKPIVQKLTGAHASFDWHYSDSAALDHAARLMSAYAAALSQLVANRVFLPTPLADPQFPDVVEYMSLSDQQTHTFQYVERAPHKLLFKAVEDSSLAKLVIKFTRRYSTELHQFCAEGSFAPALRAVAQIGAGWLMVVMDDVSNTHSPMALQFGKVSTDLEEQFRRRVSNMHEQGFVHGDIRPPNILVPREPVGTHPLLLIDFDWGGVPSASVRYPGDLNPVVPRHPEARDGEPIQVEHDTYMLNLTFSRG